MVKELPGRKIVNSDSNIKENGRRLLEDFLMIGLQANLKVALML